MTSVAGIGEFAGTGRFEIRRRLGAGGMGVVYQAWDRERTELLALKTLQHLTPAALYHLKREFRSLAGVSHPNLVALYELVADGGHWFFTMECVDGVDFLSWVREAERPNVPTEHPPTPITQTLRGAGEQTAMPVRVAAIHRFSEARLREALGGLATGVAVLHGAGYLHCDVKPANVLVTPEARVVLMDFGVAVRRGERHRNDVVGTPGYMAPEQAEGQPTEASDWYSVGVMLYEALTGDRPFRGTAHEVLVAKLAREARSPGDVNPEAPADLVELCCGLLRRDPSQRPTTDQILSRLGVGGTEPRRPLRATAGASTAEGPEPLVGRDPLLVSLRQHYAEARQGQGSTVHVHGPSGMGKTALVERFLTEVRAEPDAVVIAEKCYEQQSVPYRAVDSMVDALCQFLAGLPRFQTDALLPRHVQSLARLFPVLRRVEAIAEACRRSAVAPDPHELRRRASEALREMLGLLAATRPLVLVIDDLQWGDVDSAPLLADLMRPPDAPPLLLVACYRSEDFDKSQLLRALFRRASRLGPAAHVHHIAVEPLPDGEALTLARQLLDAAGVGREWAAEIARESRGVPYFIHELVRFTAETGGADPRTRAPAPTLDHVIQARFDRLSEEARATLGLVAVAGRPIARGVLARALGGAAGHDLATLRSALLVRTPGGRDTDTVEVYHDRVREAVLAHMRDDLRRDAHRRVAVALEATGDSDSEVLASHFLAAGDPAAAGEHALRGADAAADALAFDRAAKLYGLALELAPPEPAAAVELGVRRADALANAGRGTEAAGAYLAVADHAAPGLAVELCRRAALQYLMSGNVDDGLAVLHRVLAAHHLRLAASPTRALSALAWQRARLRLRGLRYRERSASHIAADTLDRIDMCWTAANGLAMVDPMRAAEFGTRHLSLALRSGEPLRVARALSMELGFASLAGSRTRRRVQLIAQRAEAAATRVADPYFEGWFHTCAGLADYQLGDLQAARERCERAAALFRDRCAGAWWELSTAEVILLWTLYYLGDFAELRRRVPAMLREATARGDRYAVANLKTGLPNAAWLVEDAAEAAREEASGAMQAWSRGGFHLQHYWELLALVQVDLYAGDGAAARRRVDLRWPDLERSLLLRIQSVRVEARGLRARAAIAAAAGPIEPAERAACLGTARDQVRRIEGEGVPWALSIARLLRAGIARVDGDDDGAAELLEQAEQCGGDAGMRALAAAARRQRGVLVGGDQGAALREDGERALRAAGVVAPGRLARLLVPGIERQD